MVRSVWLLSARDLQWRHRRFAIAVLAAGLAFGLTVTMTGLMNHIRLESSRIVGLFHADGWVVAHGTSGVFSTSKLVPAAASTQLAHEPGVREASALLVLRSTVGQRDVNVVGYQPGSMTEPDHVRSGRVANQAGEAMVDDSLGLRVGQQVRFAGRSFPVVGVLSNTSFYFGTPTVFLPITNVQAALLSGQPLASAIVTRGRPSTVPAAFALLTATQVRNDLNRTLAQTSQTLDLINLLLWVVAGGIIGSIIYMSALERLSEFAVMKATGATSGGLIGGLGLQALVLSLLSAVVAAIVALVIGPLFPFPVEIPTSAFTTLVVVAVVVGLLASSVVVRRVARLDPALAFGGAG
jgi:putative ABC transport system permease protein